MKLRVRGPGRTRLIAGGVLFLTFSAGVLGAAALSDLAASKDVRARASIGGAAGLEELGLSEGQRASVDAILANSQPRADAIVQTALRDLRALMDSVDAEVRAVLSPEQITTYEKLRAGGAQIQAVRRTMTRDGDTIQVDTVRVDDAR